jgi:hypothetical protein
MVQNMNGVGVRQGLKGSMLVWSAISGENAAIKLRELISKTSGKLEGLACIHGCRTVQSQTIPTVDQDRPVFRAIIGKYLRRGWNETYGRPEPSFARAVRLRVVEDKFVEEKALTRLQLHVDLPSKVDGSRVDHLRKRHPG